MNKLNRLINAYVEANRTRHSLYCKRAKATKSKFKWDQSLNKRVRVHNLKWDLQDDLALVNARLAKKKASAELRTYLKKAGLVVIWGDRNQILSIELKAKHDARKVQRKKYLAQCVKRDMLGSMDKLDLV